MKRDVFERLLARMQDAELALTKTKGKDYAGDENVLANFERLAERINLPILKIWFVYFVKHLDALETFINTERVASESITSRILDMRVYLALFHAIVSERYLLGEEAHDDNV